MASQEKKLESLLGLSAPAERKTRPDAIAHALRTAILLVDADAASVVLPKAKKKGERLVLYAGSDVPAAVPFSPAKSEALKSLAAERQALASADLFLDPVLLASDACPGVEAGPVLFVPVDVRDTAPAYLAVYRKRGRAKYTASETELLILLGAWLGATIENLRRSSRGDRLALATTTLRRELRRATRYNQELSVLRIDLDAAHDAHDPDVAHPEATAPGADATNGASPVGPTAAHVKELAAVLSQQVRSFDFVGRQGDGLMVVLPQTGRAGAMELAERIRAAVETTAFDSASAGRITATIGVACFPHEGNEVEALVAVAQRALEQGRRKGGNCVMTVALRRVA